MRVMGPSAGGWQLFGCASGPGGGAAWAHGAGVGAPLVFP